ncbi:MAG: hypothetical protein LBB89_03800 [Treponema sp.]|jgi:hypothetical protein|nr:hypothetical protein [Treponema sp.]
MEGITIEEMAKHLGKPYKTIAQRILRGGYEPVFSGNLYSKDVFEAICDVPGKGRPKKGAGKRNPEKVVKKYGNV